jgi:hypothetical protein
VRVEDLHHLRVLEQGDEVAARELTPEEVRRLRPLMEEAASQPAPIIVEPQAGGPEGMAVSLAFEDEETPRVRLAADRLPARGAGRPYDQLLAELDTLLTAELHVKAPRRAHLVSPHMLRAEE